MAHIVWKPKFETGIKKIDEQHQQLFGIINRLHEANRMGVSKAVVSEILQELLDYTIFHFKEEEEMLKHNCYPQLERQINEHKYFTDHVQNFVNEDRRQNLLLSIKIIDFLKDWLINHILGDDQEYVAYIKS